MKNYQISILAAAVMVTAYVPTTHAEGNISFSFSPPPVTSVAGPGQSINKGNVGVTFLEFEAGDETTEFSLLNLNLLSKNDGKYWSLGLVSGEDDTGAISMLGLAGMVGVEQISPSGVIISAGVGVNYLYTEFDSALVYAETYLTTIPANVTFQKRFALDERIGVTPYLTLNAVPFGFGTVDSNSVGGVSSEDIEFDPYLGLQLGFDVDLNGVSLSAYYQSADDSSVTNLSVGFEF